jgi:hypothetical protein
MKFQGGGVYGGREDDGESRVWLSIREPLEMSSAWVGRSIREEGGSIKLEGGQRYRRQESLFVSGEWHKVCK